MEFLFFARHVFFFFFFVALGDPIIDEENPITDLDNQFLKVYECIICVRLVSRNFPKHRVEPMCRDIDFAAYYIVSSVFSFDHTNDIYLETPMTYLDDEE